MSKHTEGPWFYGQDGFNLGNGVVYARHANGNPKDICHVHGWGADQQANVRFIAATPDLLAALMAVIEKAEALSAGTELIRAHLDEQDNIHTHEGWAMDELDAAIKDANGAIAKSRGAA